jgi:hypothetical protein
MRQAEINAAACGSNGASRALPPPPLTRSRYTSDFFKKIFEKWLIKKGNRGRV